MILKIDNSQDPMSLYRKTKQSQWGISLFWFSLWAFMYSAASQADFYCSGSWIILNSGSTSLPILYTLFHATQVKGKRLTAVLKFWTFPNPLQGAGFKELPESESYTFCLLVVIFSTSLPSCGTWANRKIVKGKLNDFKSS